MVAMMVVDDIDFCCSTAAHPNMMQTKGIIFGMKSSCSRPKMLGRQKCGHRAPEKRYCRQSWEFTVEAPPFPIFDLRSCGILWGLLRHSSSTILDIVSIAADLIFGESDLEDCSRPSSTPDTSISLRTFEVKHNASLDDTLTSLKTVSALPIDSDSSEVSSFFLRRSSRKRKSR
jgi:hypothetical protein